MSHFSFVQLFRLRSSQPFLLFFCLPSFLYINIRVDVVFNLAAMVPLYFIFVYSRLLGSTVMDLYDSSSLRVRKGSIVIMLVHRLSAGPALASFHITTRPAAHSGGGMGICHKYKRIMGPIQKVPAKFTHNPSGQHIRGLRND